MRAQPSEEEMAAILAAVEAVWPRPAEAEAAPAEDGRSGPWRFSGRSWARQQTGRWRRQD